LYKAFYIILLDFIMPLALLVKVKTYLWWDFYHPYFAEKKKDPFEQHIIEPKRADDRSLVENALDGFRMGALLGVFFGFYAGQRQLKWGEYPYNLF
jgi:hypothetical protein